MFGISCIPKSRRIHLAYSEDRHYPPVCSALTEAAERLDLNVGQVSWLFSLGFGLLSIGFGLGFLARSASTCLAHLQSFQKGPSITDRHAILISSAILYLSVAKAAIYQQFFAGTISQEHSEG